MNIEVIIGKAYALFDCNKNIPALQERLSDLISDMAYPSQFGIFIMGLDAISDKVIDGNYYDASILLKKAKEHGRKYLLEAEYRNASNKETADKLIGLSNQVYKSSLNRCKNHTDGSVFYENNGKYVFI